MPVLTSNFQSPLTPWSHMDMNFYSFSVYTSDSSKAVCLGKKGSLLLSKKCCGVRGDQLLWILNSNARIEKVVSFPIFWWGTRAHRKHWLSWCTCEVQRQSYMLSLKVSSATIDRLWARSRSQCTGKDNGQKSRPHSTSLSPLGKVSVGTSFWPLPFLCISQCLFPSLFTTRSPWKILSWTKEVLGTCILR